MESKDNPYLPPQPVGDVRHELSTGSALRTRPASWMRNIGVVIIGWFFAATALPVHSPTWTTISVSVTVMWAIWYMWSHRYQS